jgi:hypothetical protein
MSGSIMQFSQDLADAQPPPPLPKGPYPAEIIGAVERTSNATGNLYASIQFRIGADNYPADYTEGDPDGTVLTFNRLLIEDTPQSRWRWRKFLENVGGPLGRSVDLNSLIGLSATIEVVHQEYEGEQQASISKILAP